jgi:O-antigen/teichoic acid export membrane protein
VRALESALIARQTLYLPAVATNWRSLAASDTGRAAGMALAVVVSNVVGLAFTVAFARILGASDYGSLAVLVSAWIILMVPGSALQIAVAREVSRADASDAADPGAGVVRWVERLLLATAAVALVAIPLRGVIAAILNVDEDWAAWAVPLSGMLWMVLSVERGALQGFGRYRVVALSVIGEAAARLAVALALAGAGLDVTGAFLGTPASLLLTAVALAVPLWRLLPHHLPGAVRLGRLRDLLLGAWAPVLALTLLFALQEVHVIVVKHQASGDAAGAYAVAAVAGKAIIWVAVGLGLYLVPETARRTEAGGHARPILERTLALILAFSVPPLLIFSLAGEPLLRAAFGDDLTRGSDALPWLGLAMTLLACSYLSVQYLLALGRTGFIWALAVGVVVEVAVVAAIGADLTAVARALCAVQAGVAAIVVGTALRARAHPPGPSQAEAEAPTTLAV